MTEILSLTAAFILGAAFGWFVLTFLIEEARVRRQIKRRAANLTGGCPPSLRDRIAAVRSEIKAPAGFRIGSEGGIHFIEPSKRESA
jgi:hypothetical protein